ncbi:MAG: hypothetical protein LBL28_01050 [Treponema sp.]|jgi:hypothetical protein|nr:hypothetical protein [Treponema sp.]
MMWKYSRVLGILLLFLPVFTLRGAEITVPRLELATRAAAEKGDLVISSNAAVDIALNGGYKYGILLGLSFESANLGKAFAYRNFQTGLLAPAASVTGAEYNELAESFNNQAVLSFRVATATARNLFGLPLELSYFVGLGDPFCSGEEFSARYGVPDMGTNFTGFFYFPEGIGGNPYRRYNGIHEVQGTGFSFALTRWENFIPLLYLYQNIPSISTAGVVAAKSFYSGDLRGLFNGEKIKIEAFMGMTGGRNEAINLRGGLLAFFTSGTGMDFLLQSGIPGWFVDEEFSIDNWYFLIEPRLDFGLVAFHISFFYHPLEYLHIRTPEERGKADINIKLFVGDLGESRFQGGLETTMGVKADKPEEFSLKISPFASLASDGLRWDLKFRINPLAADHPEEILEVFVGIRTAY